MAAKKKTKKRTKKKAARKKSARKPAGSAKKRKLVTVKELAEILGCTKQAVYRRVDRGMPVAEERPRRFDLEAVTQWALDRGIDDMLTELHHTAAAPGAVVDDRPDRQSRRARGEVPPAPQARAKPKPDAPEVGEVELLVQRIASAETAEDLVQIAKESAGLTTRGLISPSVARTLKSLLSETRLSLKLRQETEPPKEDPRSLLLASEEAMRIARTYDWIVSDRRRARIMRYVLDELEEDRDETPDTDSGGALAEGT